MDDDRWMAPVGRCALFALVFSASLLACSRERLIAPDASVDIVDTSISVPDTFRPSVDAARVELDDRCKRHEDCVAIGLYPEGELRCCLACIPQRAANKSSADAFIAMCANERAMRECPVYDCAAPLLDPRCVGRRCVLAPRAQ